MSAKKKPSVDADQQNPANPVSSAASAMLRDLANDEIDRLAKRVGGKQKARAMFETAPSVRQPGSRPGRASENSIVRTGSTQLDLAIGLGGIPRHAATIIYGLYSSGKTQLALHLARSVSLSGEVALYIDAEGAVSDKLLLDIGAVADNVIIWRPDTVENTVSALLTKWIPTYGEALGTIIIDSIPTLATNKEREAAKSEKDRVMMEKARVWTEKLQELTNACIENNIALVAINQLRENGEDMYGNTLYRKPGGRVWEYVPGLFILTKKGNGETDAERKATAAARKSGEGVERVFTDFVIEKNKVGVPWRKGTIEFVPGRAYPYVRDVVRAALSENFYADFGSHAVIKDTKFDKKTGELTTESATNTYTVICRDRVGEALEEELDELSREEDFEGKDALVRFCQDGLDNGYASVRFKSALVETLADLPRVVRAIDEVMRDALAEANTYSGTTGVPNEGKLGTGRRSGSTNRDDESATSLPEAGEAVDSRTSTEELEG